MEAFLSKDPAQQETLADLIVQRIKEKDASVASGNTLLHFILLILSFILVLVLSVFSMFVLSAWRYYSHS